MLTYIFLPRHLASAAGTGHWMNCVFGLSQYSCSYGQLMRWSQQRPTAAHGKKMGTQNAWRVKPITETNGNFFRVNAWQKARRSACKILSNSKSIFT